MWAHGSGEVLTAVEASCGGWLLHRVSIFALFGGSTPVFEPHLLTGGPSLPVEVDTLQNGGAFVDLARLGSSVRLPRGAHRHLTLQQVGPGQYEAPLPDGGPGVYRVTVRRDTSPRSQVDAALAVPYPPEYLPRPPDLALLSQLAAITGGHVLHDPGQLKAASTAMEDLWWPLAALALLLFLSDVTLRLVGRDRDHRPITHH